MLLVHLANAFEDLDRFLLGRFIHHDGLETAFQCRISLNMFAVFVQGSGADHLQLAA